MTAATAPRLRTDHLWETSLFSSSARSGRGWDAPTYDGIDDQLADSRSRLTRLSARAAYQEALYGRALLVDIRPQAQRAQEGEVHPGLAPLLSDDGWAYASSLPLTTSRNAPRPTSDPYRSGLR